MTRGRVCLVDAGILAQGFAEAGWEVENIPARGGFLDIARELETRGFVPDLLLQQEHLGARLLLTGLENLSCPRIFWSVDTHLNGFWQRHYARLFDGLLTTQPHMLEEFGDAPPAARLAWPGREIPWTGWGRRTRDVGFVGRLTPQRPARQWMTEFLSRHYRVDLAQDVSMDRMFEFYAHTRLAPNEAIMGEVNFRVLEAASAGSLVITPEVPGQEEILEPGREIAVYANVLELKNLLDHYLGHPEEARAMARAAWERVGREHLPRHRAARVLEFSRELVRRGSQGDEARRDLALAACNLFDSNRLTLETGLLADILAMAPEDGEVLAAKVRFLAREGQEAACLGLLGRLAASGVLAGDPDLDLAGSMAGLRLGEWSLAVSFWRRRERAAGRERPAVLDSPRDLLVAWAGELVRLQRIIRRGFPFDPERLLPATAVDCLVAAQELAPDDLEITRRLENLLAGIPGAEASRLAMLSHLSLHQPDNWRIGLALGTTNLKAFRPEEGLADLVWARDRAAAQGREKLFDAMLAAEDPGGLAAGLLAGA
jgi:hypothetical protein